MTKNKDQQGLFLPLIPVIIPETQEHNSHESQEQKNIYFQALDESLTNNQVHNIALLGPYGSGKSSVIKSYIASRNLESHTITVTLGNYENNQDFSTGANSTQTAYERNANSIERQIILQLSSQIPSHKIKGSPYAFHTERTVREKVTSLVAIASFFIGVLALTSTQIYNLFVLAITYPYIDIIMFLMILFPVIYGVWLFLNSERFELSKINVNLGAASTELNKSSNHDETILDKDIKQIVNMLIRSQAKIVVFEDLDRFNDIEIFNKLKRINLLVNNRLKSNASDSKITFLYLSHDGLFTKTDRTKYFDHIIPIVPIFNERVAKDYFIEKLDNIKNTIELDFHKGNKHHNEFIEDISTFVKDLRIANNIVNEFIIYYTNSDWKKFNLDWKRLFALVVFKNLVPEEFEQFRQGKGQVYNFITAVIRESRHHDNSSNNGLIESIPIPKRQDFINLLEENIQELVRYLVNEKLIVFGELSKNLYDLNKALYKSDLSIRDYYFIDNIMVGEADINYKLDKPDVVYKYLKNNDYKTKNILNHSLICFILNEQPVIRKRDLIIWEISQSTVEFKRIHILLKLLDSISKEENKLHHAYFLIITNHENNHTKKHIFKCILEELYVEHNQEFNELAKDISLFLLQKSLLNSEIIDSYRDNFKVAIESALQQSSEKDQIDVERIFAELQKLQIQLNPQAFSADHYLYNRILQHNASFTLTSTPAHNEDEVKDDAQHK